jgi:hypothetical protein
MTVGPSARSADLLTAAEPPVAPSAVVDPNWLRLRGDSLLPSVYMPAPMRGSHSIWLRTMAVVLVSVFVLATALGVCLTYGPPTGW